MKIDVVFDGTRYLDVHFEDDEEFRVQATTESGNHLRESKTWNFEHPVTKEKYRVQFQIIKE